MDTDDLISRLLAGSAKPGLPETLAMAGTMAQAPLRRGPWQAPVAGLAADEFDALLGALFPGAAELHPLLREWHAAAPAVAGDGGDNEFDDLVALLRAHEAYPAADGHWLACAVATASMADNHLWQDLGLPSRGELNALMLTRFTALKLKNSGDMKWKKFFYRQLCEAAEVLICKSPSCGVCTDYKVCFGPEE